MNKTTRKILITAAGIASILGYQSIEKNCIKINYKELHYPDLDYSLENYGICHISDLHSGSFGKDNIRLVEIINRLKPRILCMTGDMIENDTDDGEIFLKFISMLDPEIVKLYVSGNHENYTRSGFKTIVSNRTVFYNKVRNAGVRVLHNESYKDEVYPISFSGIEDNHCRYEGQKFQEDTFAIEEHMEPPVDGLFNVALVHRPNYFRSFARYGYDLMLSGHTHGGLIRIYGLGGLLSPDRKFFPEFDKGLFRYGKSYLNVSSGLHFPMPVPKIGNRPEVNYITLHRGNYNQEIKQVE